MIPTWNGATFEVALSAQISAMNAIFGSNNPWIVPRSGGIYDNDDGAIATYSSGELQVTKDIHTDGNVDANGNIITDGSVGIGVTSPSDELEIRASSGQQKCELILMNSTTANPAGIKISISLREKPIALEVIIMEVVFRQNMVVRSIFTPIKLSAC